MSDDWKKDDRRIPSYMWPRFNPSRTKEGWDFSKLALDRPPPLTGLAALHYIHGAPKKIEQAIGASREHDELLEDLVIGAFYLAGMDADQVWALATVYDAEEIHEGDTIFLVEDDHFLVITGRDKSMVEMPPLAGKWLQFDSGYYRKGVYTPRGIDWHISTPFPSSKVRIALFPERKIEEKKVYKIL